MHAKNLPLEHQTVEYGGEILGKVRTSNCIA